jgi:hypothetical protein
MKRFQWACAAAVVASLAVGTFVHAQAKPQKGVLVGTVVDIGSYAMLGMSEDQIPAHKARIEEGFPVGVIDEDGKMWVCVYRDNAPASHLETANKYMADFAGMKCAIQGLKYEADGVNVIRVSVISEY